MNRSSHNYFQKFISWVKSIFQTDLQNEIDQLTAYSSLSPIDDAEENTEYANALLWALKNRSKKDIKNIALTGPYGSGKSSILKTFQKNYKGSDLHFLNISLATFKEEEKEVNEEKEVINPKDAKGTDELLRLIELSILQQIFYHEDDRQIPDSRFKKIRSYGRKELIFISITIILFITSVLNLIYPRLLKYLLKIEYPDKVTNFIHYCSVAISFICSAIIIYKSIRIFSGIRISKVNIADGEIEINENVSKSILNHHLDEILYFFEVTEYNVVIVEDLDRFRQTEIFTKLREINLLLNSSKKTAYKHICFIYAVRDEMFIDKDRTKFFDFIIPVIPIINSSNSSEKLLEKQNIHSYNFSEDLIEDISLFIDDMRLLHNILNEFYLYFHKLNKKIDKNKLLAMLIYKNIFPNDFACLSNNEGVLFDCIKGKYKYLGAQDELIKQKIEDLKTEIDSLEKIQIFDSKELRALYILKYITSFNGFSSFIINGTEKTVDQMLEEVNFEHLIQNSTALKYQSHNTHYPQVNNLKFEKIEKLVDVNHTYLARKKQIDDFISGKIEDLKKEIEQAEKQRIVIKNYSLKQVLSQGNLDIAAKNEKQKNLLDLLLRNGYIDEDYNEYISIFYPGSITRPDYQFLLSVKSQQQLSFDYTLYRIDKLITKINILEFEKEYILNYDLISYIIDKKEYEEHRNRIFNKLKDESENSIRFIDGFIGFRPDVSAFVFNICRTWKGIWKFIEDRSVFSEEKKMLYLKIILTYSDLNDLDMIAAESNLLSTILQQKNFLNIIPDVDRIKRIIKLFDIKFKSLDLRHAPTELVDFVYLNGYYEFNYSMIKDIIVAKGNLSSINFDTKNYYAIKTSGCNELISYIQSNLNQYILDLYLNIESNTQEDEEAYLELLNSKISIGTKKEIIQKVQTKINSLTETEDHEVDALLLEASGVAPTWENLVNYFQFIEAEVMPVPIITFLNNLSNAEELAKSKVPHESENFIDALIKENLIKDESYDLILRAVPIQFREIDFSKLRSAHVTLLIKNGILLASTENYTLLKSSFPGLHIRLLEKQKVSALANLSLFEIDAGDLNQVLHSGAFTNEEKNVVIENVDEKLLTSNPDSITQIGSLIIENHGFRVNQQVAQLVLSSAKLSVTERIEIFNIKHSQISNEFISEFLSSLGEPFSEIAINGKRPLLDTTHQNKLLADILYSKNYISSFEEEKKGIRISTFRKTQDIGE